MEENTTMNGQQLEPIGDGWDELVTAEDLAVDAEMDGYMGEGEAEDEPTAADGAGQPEDAAPGSEAPEPTYKVKYNGQEMDLPASELVRYAQMGMNYPKLQQQLEQQATPYQAFIEQVAGMNNMTPAQYMDWARGEMERQATKRLADQGLTEPAARQLYQMQQKLQQLEEERNLRVQADQRAARESEQRRGFEKLLERYPDVKQLPDEVVQAILEDNAPPLYAYEAYLARQYKTQQAAMAADAKNRQTAPGSATGLGGEVDKDPFLLGWDSASP